VPLKAIFFLKQAKTDSVKTLNLAQVSSLLVNSTQQVNHLKTAEKSLDEIHCLNIDKLSSTGALAREVPAYRLNISLNGKFWEEIEKTLARQPQGKPEAKADGPIPVIYTGPSMNPTLRQGDLLDVVPYEDKMIQVGDVIYFQRPGDKAIVHRVCAITASDVRTRGDNNPCADPYWLKAKEIIGKVTAARRQTRVRPIHGGTQGRLSMRVNLLRHGLFLKYAPKFRGVYRWIVRWGILPYILPAKLKPKVVIFQKNSYEEHFKIVMNGKEIGRFDEKDRVWRIQPPYRLFVDEARLLQPELRYPFERKIGSSLKT
jgi:signal peptidase I